MASCPGCGREIRDDIWVCGYCGELVAGSRRETERPPLQTTGSATVISPHSPAEPSPADAPPGDPVNESRSMPTLPGTGAPAAAGVMPSAPPPSEGSPPDAVMPTLPPSGGQRPGPAPLPLGTPAVATSGAGALDSVGALESTGTPSLAHGTLPSTAPAKERTGISHAVLIAAVLGIAAVVAVVAVWFFVLRGGPGGDLTPFVGDWQLTVPGATVTQTMVIEDADGEGQLLFDVQGQRAGPYKLEFDGDRLVTSFEPTDDASEEQKQAAEMIRSAFGSMVDDFRMVFVPGADADSLTMTVEGEMKGAGTMGDLSGQAVTLTRAPTAQ